MTYFKIKTTSDKKVIGSEFPQIQTMGGEVDRNAPNSLYNVYPDKFPLFAPALNYFILNRNAKLTDILSASMISFGLILNDKVKSILERYKLPPHKFFPSVVYHNQKHHNNYYWFFYISDVFDFIDYKSTHFFISDMVDNKIEDCKNINSAQSLRNIQKELPFDRNIDSKLIYFKRDIVEELDLFEVTFGNYQNYVSPNLCKSLIEERITGLDISESNKLIVEI